MLNLETVKPDGRIYPRIPLTRPSFPKTRLILHSSSPPPPSSLSQWGERRRMKIPHMWMRPGGGPPPPEVTLFSALPPFQPNLSIESTPLGTKYSRRSSISCPSFNRQTWFGKREKETSGGCADVFPKDTGALTDMRMHCNAWHSCMFEQWCELLSTNYIQ